MGISGDTARCFQRLAFFGLMAGDPLAKRAADKPFRCTCVDGALDFMYWEAALKKSGEYVKNVNASEYMSAALLALVNNHEAVSFPFEWMIF